MPRASNTFQLANALGPKSGKRPCRILMLVLGRTKQRICLESLPCPRAPSSPSLLTHRPIFSIYPPPPFPQLFQQAHIYLQPPQFQQAPLLAQASTSHQAFPQPRQWACRRRKAEEEDKERMTMGGPPKKRMAKANYHYTCKDCGQGKNKNTGYTQHKGRWY